MPDQFSITDLMDLLVQQRGLPERFRTSRLDLCLSDLGLDSVDFAILQLELQEGLGVQLPDEQGSEFTLGEIVGSVQAQLRRRPLALPRPAQAPLPRVSCRETPLVQARQHSAAYQ